MLALSLSSPSLNTGKHCLSPQLQSHQSRILLDTRKQSLSSISYNPFRGSIKKTMLNQKRHGFGAVCYSGPLTPENLQWIATISSSVLMLTKGTAIHKSFLPPLFALQAPAIIVSWIKGEYGIWSAFLSLLVRLFFSFPGELELPFITLLLIIVCPYEITRLRGSKEGLILSLVIAAYLAFQHFTRAGSLRKAFDQGSIIATIAMFCVVAVPCLLLI